MVFGELVPKNIAIAEPLATAKTVVDPDAGLDDAVPTADRGAQRHRQRRAADDRRRAAGGAALRAVADELDSLVRRSAAQGTLERPTAGLLARSLSFSGKTADDVLTPRVRVRFVKATDTADALLAAAAETGHSRFPVSGEDSDDVVGSGAPQARGGHPARRTPGRAGRGTDGRVPVVPGSIPLDDLMDELRSGLQMAVVADEYGGTAGILTLEDVVEELVGEINDEHDPVDSRAERRPDDTWLLPGTLRPDEIVEITGVRLPESNAYETVAGQLIARLGRMPKEFDSVEVDATMDASAHLGIPDGQVIHSDDSRIAPETEDDLPRAVTVRLTVHGRARRRIEAVLLSAVSLNTGDDGDGENGDRRGDGR